MEEIKCKRSYSFDDDDKQRKKIQVTTCEMNWCLSREVVTYFEDLSNEVIYEVFEFLDYFHVYKAFFNLNLRFHNLITNSTLLIKTNIPFMSKSDFKCYNNDIIMTNTHRITSLGCSCLFMYDLDSSPFHKISTFIRLERFLIYNIETKHLQNLVHQLISLPLLSSLIITLIDDVKNKSTIYYEIFRLPSLKYCKLSLKGQSNNDPLPLTTNDYSPIEYLVINHDIHLDELYSMLSYVPKLRCLSLHSLKEYSSNRTRLFPIVLNYLTNVFVKLHNIQFDQFEQLIINIFQRVQFLHISKRNGYNTAYIDAKRWEQLILSHMPKLRVFDIQFDIDTQYDRNRLTIETQIDQFISPFWIERQWFFAHDHYCRQNNPHIIFYSKSSYSRKEYILYKQLNENTCLHDYEPNVNSVEHVRIQSEESIFNCRNYFSNATELTFEDSFSKSHYSVATELNFTIPLKHITRLNIESCYFTLEKLVGLLYFIPNIHTLVLKTIRVNQNNYTSIQQNANFRLISNTYNITNMTIKAPCKLKKIQLLVALCPRLQNLTFAPDMQSSESIIRFMLNKTNSDTRHLFSLCFSKMNNRWLNKSKLFIESETLLGNYLLKIVNQELHLWR